MGANQIQVNRATNLTFAKGLKSIVRQDPDVILVGEIRDIETAEIAVNAALTGHLLLTTFHANDAATTVPRLLDMGVEPFLMASTLELIISQRLVRRLCEHCRYSYTANVKDLQNEFPDLFQYLKESKVTLYKGKGCPSCNNSGYKGRMAVFEFIQINAELKELFLKHPSTNELWSLARQFGATSMFEDGLEKVLSGLTSLPELYRVAQPPTHINYQKK
jgi:type II secretory ATPase GspE/PulE/Tfp pilus assembly ATPase PilB-like protein